MIRQEFMIRQEEAEPLEVDIENLKKDIDKYCAPEINEKTLELMDNLKKKTIGMLSPEDLEAMQETREKHLAEQGAETYSKYHEKRKQKINTTPTFEEILNHKRTKKPVTDIEKYIEKCANIVERRLLDIADINELRSLDQAINGKQDLKKYKIRELISMGEKLGGKRWKPSLQLESLFIRKELRKWKPFQDERLYTRGTNLGAVLIGIAKFDCQILPGRRSAKEGHLLFGSENYGLTKLNQKYVSTVPISGDLRNTFRIVKDYAKMASGAFINQASIKDYSELQKIAKIPAICIGTDNILQKSIEVRSGVENEVGVKALDLQLIAVPEEYLPMASKIIDAFDKDKRIAVVSMRSIKNICREKDQSNVRADIAKLILSNKNNMHNPHEAGELKAGSGMHNPYLPVDIKSIKLEEKSKLPNNEAPIPKQRNGIRKLINLCCPCTKQER